VTLPAGARVGPYEVVSPLGRGGMGEVLLARDTRLGRRVALKILPGLLAGDTERLSRFEREARILASLNHPNIATMYGIEETDGVRAIAMELVEGETLAAWIARERYGGRPGSIDRILNIAKQIAEALDARTNAASSVAISSRPM